jgi:Family of unknown function (DUF6461)
MAEATAADYAWFTDHWLRQAFCFSLVRGLDQAEVLRRLGGERSQPRRLTLGEAAELSGSFHAGYPKLVLAAKVGGWAVAVEDNGYQGSRPEVLRVPSRGTPGGLGLPERQRVRALQLRGGRGGAGRLRAAVPPAALGQPAGPTAPTDARRRAGPRPVAAALRDGRPRGAGAGRAAHWRPPGQGNTGRAAARGRGHAAAARPASVVPAATPGRRAGRGDQPRRAGGAAAGGGHASPARSPAGAARPRPGDSRGVGRRRSRAGPPGRRRVAAGLPDPCLGGRGGGRLAGGQRPLRVTCGAAGPCEAAPGEWAGAGAAD